MKARRDPLEGWACEGQQDLTDLVDIEHISGSMPAADSDLAAARERFYDDLRERTKDIT